jgi:molybdate transport system ATP-binding protein
MFVQLQDVTLQLGEREAFSRTTWRIETGQNWAITGENGSGKSILSRSLLRQLPLKSGRILYSLDDPAYPSGRPFFYPGEALLFSAETHRSFLNQYASYYQARFQSFEGEDVPSVAHILDWRFLGSRSRFETVPKGLPAGYDQKLKDLVDLFHLAPLMERSVHQLSHGESRKVFLARLFLRSPKLIVLDDPFTGLDETTRARFRQAIDRLFMEHQGLVVLVGGRLSDLPASITHLLTVSNLRVVSQDKWRPTISEDESGFRTAVQDHSPIQKEVPVNSTGKDNSNLVDMKNIVVEYDGLRVLNDISWSICQGERWALVGPNGAGKSTLLSLILADHPQSYRMDICLFGRKRGSGESIWEIKRKIGWVSPELHIFYEPHFTCREVVASGFFDSVGLFRQCTPDQLHTSARILDSFGLSALSDQPFQSLSAGQQRLVLLGRALIKNPPLLVLDEPCQGLDDHHRQEFLALLDQVCARSSIAMIYVSHYQDELPSCITHQMRLDSGAVMFSGRVISP